MKTLEEHPLYSSLRPHEHELASLLVASGEPYEVLPFRLDAKIGYGLVASAETLVPDAGILVVTPDEDDAAAWEDLWTSQGRLSAANVSLTAPGPAYVNITSIEGFSWHEDDYRRRHFDLVLTVGLKPEADDLVRQVTASAEIHWRTLFAGDYAGEELGAPGHFLVHGLFPAPLEDVVLRPHPRSRLSPLAARAS
jgi:hypothetical protein